MRRKIWCCWLAAACAVAGCASTDDGASHVDAGDTLRGASGAAGASAAGAGQSGASAAGASGQGAAGVAGASGAANGTTVFASEVVSFAPGEGAGHGQDKMPDVVLGPPNGGGSLQGSLDVVSLGVGGEIVLSFGDADIVDREGPDFVVFENAFWAGGDEQSIWKELGEVSVSVDGVSWKAFPCVPASFMSGSCAGWHVVYAAASTPLPYDPAKVGGDPFDLATIGVARVRYVKIKDLGFQPAPPNAGFDLDAVAALHVERR